jgi:ATP-dependent RNA helicase DbpA
MLLPMSADFGSLNLSPELLAVVAELGYEKPTPIQAQCIPLMLSGIDVIGQSQTGSGKTASFALPVLQKLAVERRSLQALVLCPTRELCAQVAREVRKLGRRLPGLGVLVVSGGEPVRAQAQALERGVHVVVGSPGRVLDHRRRGTLELGAVSTVVLDEADRMLDMGFQADVEEILSGLPQARQTVFFSATFPDSIRTMSRRHQRCAVRISIDEEVQVAPEIRQQVVAAEPDQKLRALCWVLGRIPHESALIFCNLKATVAELDRDMASLGLSVDCLHGDLEQFERNQVMARFRNHSVRYLIATDVAARGIDVIDLDIVVNYDLPALPEVYVHRIGRTGRAGKDGIAVSLATARENHKLDSLEGLTHVALEHVSWASDRSPGAAALVKELVRDARMATLRIGGGRKDKVRPGDILGALTGEAGRMNAEDIGRIEILDRLTYVAVAKRLARDALRSLSRGRIKGKRFRISIVGRIRP